MNRYIHKMNIYMVEQAIEQAKEEKKTHNIFDTVPNKRWNATETHGFSTLPKEEKKEEKKPFKRWIFLFIILILLSLVIILIDAKTTKNLEDIEEQVQNIVTRLENTNSQTIIDAKTTKNLKEIQEQLTRGVQKIVTKLENTNIQIQQINSRLTETQNPSQQQQEEEK